MNQYTIIPPHKAGFLTSEMDKLSNWIPSALDAVSKIVEWEERDIVDAKERAISCVLSGPDSRGSINAIACGHEEGDDLNFLFSALKTVRDLLAIADEKRWHSIYINQNSGVGYNGLKRYMPRNISF